MPELKFNQYNNYKLFNKYLKFILKKNVFKNKIQSTQKILINICLQKFKNIIKFQTKKIFYR